MCVQCNICIVCKGVLLWCCLYIRCGPALLTGDVVLRGRLPIQPVEICMSVCLWGVDPVPHCQALHGRTSRGQGWRRGVVLGANPGERARARIRRVAAVARNRRHSGAVAVIHSAHQDLTAAVLREHGLLGGVGGAAATGGEVGGAKHRAWMVIGQRATPASSAATLADVRRGAGAESLLIGGLAFSGGRTRAQVGQLGQRRGRRRGRWGGVLKTWSGGFAGAPVSLWEGSGMFPLLRPGAGAVTTGKCSDRLKERRRSGDRNWKENNKRSIIIIILK